MISPPHFTKSGLKLIAKDSGAAPQCSRRRSLRQFGPPALVLSHTASHICTWVTAVSLTAVSGK